MVYTGKLNQHFRENRHSKMFELLTDKMKSLSRNHSNSWVQDIPG
jgi:hypothetical protein